MNEVRVRFAPSPTGYLHVGGVRTALFNWLFARHYGGKFYLRIEDTDRSRSTEEAIEAITDGLTWLGLTWDRWSGWPSDPARQTERMEIYRTKVDQLLSRGLAYPCYCLPEELEMRRKEAIAQGRTPRYDGRCRQLKNPLKGQQTPAIRFKTDPESVTVVQDLVKGPVIFENSTLDDLIILRSDGTPTYNFCVVVDDVEMAISHVIRGDDHLNNTPRQIQLYRALDFEIPKFAHLSMILGSDRTRLSKRHGATSVQWYREEGYLPEALINYLVRLGWSHQDQEIFTLKELIDKFSLDQVGSSAAVFNPEKLLWINAHYIKAGNPKELVSLFSSFLAKAANLPEEKVGRDPRLEAIIAALQERSRTLREMGESALCFFTDPPLEEEAKKKFLTHENLALLQSLHDRFQALPSFAHEDLEPVFQAIMAEYGYKMARVAQPVRVAVTGKSVSPGIYEVLSLVGKERTLKRLERAIELIKKGATES
jgi:glutamyl-tRNA synthetase